LWFQRDDLVAYLRDSKCHWRDDSSNQDLGFTRNRVRHELIPLLESFNPNINHQLTSYCRQLQQDEMFWAMFVDEKLAECSQRFDDGLSLDRNKLQAMPPALSSRVVRQALSAVRGDLRGISSLHIESILILTSSGPVQGELDLPGAWIARRYDQVYIHKERPVAETFFEITLEDIGCYQMPDGRRLTFSLEKMSRGEHLGAVEFSADKVIFPLTVRSSLPGDRIRPSGMPGSKKLQDLFVDKKLPREDRQKALLLMHEDEVLWVAGVRRCEGYCPEPGKEVLRVTLEPQIPS
jgi:tRNA(Ile)-lysidine synthase